MSHKMVVVASLIFGQHLQDLFKDVKIQFNFSLVQCHQIVTKLSGWPILLVYTDSM